VERTTIAGETEVLGENLPQRYFIPPQIPHDQVRFRTPDRSGGKPATNRLSYGAALNVRYLSYPVVLLNYCCFIFHCASAFCCFCCCLCFTMDISLTPCYLVAAYGQLHPPPRCSPPNSRVPCGDLSNVSHEVCALQRTSCARVAPALVFTQL
jgi:hypothetical protein